MSDVRRAGPADAEVLGRLLWDFNTEFETETDDADVLAARFARLLPLDEIVAVLAEGGGEPVGFALVSLRPAIWFDGPVSQLEELYVVPRLRSHGIGTQVLDLSRRIGLPTHRTIEDTESLWYAAAPARVRFAQNFGIPPHQVDPHLAAVAVRRKCRQ